MSFGVIDVFISLPREVLFVFNTISRWFQLEQLCETCSWISILVTHIDITQLIRTYTNLISCVISYVVKPAMPFWWDLRGIVAILGCVFHPPMSTYKNWIISDESFGCLDKGSQMHEEKCVASFIILKITIWSLKEMKRKTIVWKRWCKPVRKCRLKQGWLVGGWEVGEGMKMNWETDAHFSGTNHPPHKLGGMKPIPITIHTNTLTSL